MVKGVASFIDNMVKYYSELERLNQTKERCNVFIALAYSAIGSNPYPDRLINM